MTSSFNEDNLFEGSTILSFDEKKQISDWFNNKKCSVLHISCGAFHTICLLDDNSVYGFGNNEYREVGLYQSDIINYPSRLHFRCAWDNTRSNDGIYS